MKLSYVYSVVVFKIIGNIDFMVLYIVLEVSRLERNFAGTMDTR